MNDIAAVPKTHLVLVALHDVGGEADLETIAVRAWEMFPQQFCWRRYPQYPDKDIVRINLSDAKRDPGGVLVVDTDLRHSNPQEGRLKRYALTPLGREKVNELKELLEVARPSASRVSLDHRRLIMPILSSEAFTQFSAGVAIEIIGREAFLRAFKLFADASPYVISARLARTEAAVAEEGHAPERDKLATFIEGGRRAFRL